jgi:fumarate reductase subunit D
MESISLLRNLSLVLGATILSVFGPNMLRLFPEGSIGNLVLLVLAVFLLLYGFGSIEKVLSETRIRFRNSRFICPRVAILYGVSRDFSDEIPKVWSDISPEEWENEIQEVSKALGKKIKVKLIYSNDPFDSYNAILNPYGGNYPETSFDGFPVYNRILDYIRRGGLFVNVADIPTYWAYNPRLKRMLDRTPAVYGVAGEEVRFFQCVPLMQELALRVRNIESLGPPVWPMQMIERYSDFGMDMTDVLASRAVIVEGNVESVILPIKVGDDNMTPLLFCNYGDGRCLISLTFFEWCVQPESSFKNGHFKTRC